MSGRASLEVSGNVSTEERGDWFGKGDECIEFGKETKTIMSWPNLGMTSGSKSVNNFLKTTW